MARPILPFWSPFRFFLFIKRLTCSPKLVVIKRLLQFVSHITCLVTHDLWLFICVDYILTQKVPIHEISLVPTVVLEVKCSDIHFYKTGYPYCSTLH